MKEELFEIFYDVIEFNIQTNKYLVPKFLCVCFLKIAICKFYRLLKKKQTIKITIIEKKLMLSIFLIFNIWSQVKKTL